MWRLTPSSHWERFTLIRDAITLTPRMQLWVARTRVIAILLFMYLQIREYRYFHFCVRRLAMSLSAASTSTPISPSTESTKEMKCQRSLRQVLKYFFFFLCSTVSRQFLVFLV